MWYAIKSNGDVKTRLSYAISIFDLNDDGLLTRDEIKTVLSKILIFMVFGYIFLHFLNVSS